MSEKTYQSKLIKEYEGKGYYVLKLIKTNKNGIPDLLLLKDGIIHFIEVKGSKGVLSELQKYRIKELKSYGFTAEARFEPN
jgi:Holliday junction resolvase